MKDKSCFSLTALFVVVLSLFVFGAAPAVAAPRAFILYNPNAPGGAADKANLVRALQESGWVVDTMAVGRGVGGGSVQTVMNTFFNTPAGNTDAKLLYYSGHGATVTLNGNPVDDPPTGEPTSSPGDESYFGVRDDVFPSVAGYSGPVVAIFDSCKSGGFFDGSDDASQG